MRQPSQLYNLLKFALQTYGRVPAELDRAAYEMMDSKAAEECRLQSRILASEEGLKVFVPEQAIQEALVALAERYESPRAFEQDMAANGLDLCALEIALEVELAVSAAIAQVAAKVELPSEAEVNDILLSSSAQPPDKRHARHILITINDDFPENRRAAALARINKIRDEAVADDANFSEIAQRYSECPSALQGGSLGPVGKGVLFAKLEEVLFAMQIGEVSEVVETAMGFHLLFCEEVVTASSPDPKAIKAKIRKTFHNKAKKKAVRAWLAALNLGEPC